MSLHFRLVQAPQIWTPITWCGNTKQIQPWVGKSSLALLKQHYAPPRDGKYFSGLQFHWGSTDRNLNIKKEVIHFNKIVVIICIYSCSGALYHSTCTLSQVVIALYIMFKYFRNLFSMHGQSSLHLQKKLSEHSFPLAICLGFFLSLSAQT